MTDRRMPTLRVAPRVADLNINGNIFGGWILSQMDVAAGVVAARRAGGKVATVAVDKMTFYAPMLTGDLVNVYAEIGRVGKTSMAVDIDVFSERLGLDEPVRITRGTFTFVAIDENGKPRPVDA